MAKINSLVDDILNLWFPDDEYHLWWFKKNVKFDNKLHDEYFNLMINTFNNFNIENYNNCESKKIICDIIILDQFSRNINRIINTLNIIEYTNRALQLSNLWIKNKYHLSEPIKWTVFAFLPIRHSKNKDNLLELIKTLNEIETKYESILLNKIYYKFKLHTIRQL